MAKSLEEQLAAVEAAIEKAEQGDYRVGSRYSGRQQILATLYKRRDELQDRIDRNGGPSFTVIQPERPT